MKKFAVILFAGLAYVAFAAEGDRAYKNPNQDKDLSLCVNDGGVETCPVVIDGASAELEIGDYQELDISSSGDFSAAQPLVKAYKQGRRVTLTWNSLTHTSSGTPSTATGWLPSEFRPPYGVVNVYILGAARVKRVAVDSNGTFRFEYRNWSGSVSFDTVTNAGTISYLVD